MAWDDKACDEMTAWDEMTRHEVRWQGMRWDGMWWDGNACDEWDSKRKLDDGPDDEGSLDGTEEDGTLDDGPDDEGSLDGTEEDGMLDDGRDDEESSMAPKRTEHRIDCNLESNKLFEVFIYMKKERTSWVDVVY